MNEIREVNRYTITVGLSDSDTLKQKEKTEWLLEFVSRCCREYGLAFSCVAQKGGYADVEGKYVEENSLALSFVDGDEEKVNYIARDICCFLNQKEVLVTVDTVKCYYVSERIEKRPNSKAHTAE